MRLGELILVYQPIHDVASGAMVGLEALARWRRDGADVATPETFIALAEQSGLIVEFGRQVLRMACTQLALWSGTRYESVPVSVNISPQQLQDPDFVQDVCGSLQAHAVDAHRLVIEITEREALGDSLYAASAIAALREIGVKVVLDDFGGGYMNLAVLLRYGIDGLKLSLETPWGEEAQTDPRAWEVIRAIAQMCRGIGISLVVERVETLRQWVLLQGLPEVRAQGYLLGKPTMPDALHRVASPLDDDPRHLQMFSVHTPISP